MTQIAIHVTKQQSARIYSRQFHDPQRIQLLVSRNRNFPYLAWLATSYPMVVARAYAQVDMLPREESSPRVRS